MVLSWMALLHFLELVLPWWWTPQEASGFSLQPVCDLTTEQQHHPIGHHPTPKVVGRVNQLTVAFWNMMKVLVETVLQDNLDLQLRQSSHHGSSYQSPF